MFSPTKLGPTEVKVMEILVSSKENLTTTKIGDEIYPGTPKETRIISAASLIGRMRERGLIRKHEDKTIEPTLKGIHFLVLAKKSPQKTVS